jgi:hypothetical protein
MTSNHPKHRRVWLLSNWISSTGLAREIKKNQLEKEKEIYHACSFITGSMVLRKTDAFFVESDSSMDENKSSVPLPIPQIDILSRKQIGF